MPGKKGAKSKASQQAQKSARKAADALVVTGNAHLARATAATRPPQQLEALAMAEAAYQQAAAAMAGGVHLDSAYNLGVCAAMRAAAAARASNAAAHQVASLQARRQFEAVIAGDTSGRSETLALSHAALAALIAQSVPPPGGSGGQGGTAAALAAVDAAAAHYGAAVVIRKGAGDHASVTALQLQAGDAHAIAMRWCLAGASAAAGGRGGGAAGGAAALSAAVVRCEAACALYDEGLRSPWSCTGGVGEAVGDVQLLEQKARVLHGLTTWGAEHAGTEGGAPMPPPFAAALGAAHDCVKALGALLLGEGEIEGGGGGGGGGAAAAAGAAAAVAAAGGGRAQAVLLVMCGDLLEMCAGQHEEPAAAREVRAAALHMFQCATELAPIADAHASAAELMLDEGRAALARASSAGSADASAAEAAAGADLLRRSAAGFRMSAQLEPEDNGVHIYNAACAAALLRDDAACVQALAELRAQRAAGGSVAADAAGLLADMAQDSDFERVQHTPWFTSREAPT
jgi:hypothetical protein